MLAMARDPRRRGNANLASEEESREPSFAQRIEKSTAHMKEKETYSKLGTMGEGDCNYAARKVKERRYQGKGGTHRVAPQTGGRKRAVNGMT